MTITQTLEVNWSSLRWVDFLHVFVYFSSYIVNTRRDEIVTSINSIWRERQFLNGIRQKSNVNRAI